MGILRWDPFSDMVTLRDQINRMFEESMSRNTGRPAAPAPSRTWAPVVDILEDNDKIAIKVDLPGIKQDDIHIDLTGDVLTLSGERRFEDEERKDSYVRVERIYGSFQRSFQLGVPIEVDKVTASYQDGILTVTLPKSEAVKPRRVEIKASSDKKRTYFDEEIHQNLK